ncbi:MAG TPA: acylphosphatase [Armatimonadota bacterium]|nr:acylphosphatase [Armatimonadota bacterium]
MDSSRRLHATVRGTVQGVGFRAFVVREARRLGLRGYVRNRPDGSVEACAEGPETSLRLFERSLRAGPPASRVQWLDVEWSDASGEFAGFEVRY